MKALLRSLRSFLRALVEQRKEVGDPDELTAHDLSFVKDEFGWRFVVSPDYWALYRYHFPERFASTAAKARGIGARLARINDERVFIDDIPADWPMRKPIVPACDFLCAIAEKEAA